jgi:hypothetical protein
MKTINLFRICLLIFLSLLHSNSYGSIVWRSLPKLIHEAPVIAKGKISIQDDKIILNVDKILKGQDSSQIIVLYRHWFEVPDPKFKDGEYVLLFLHTPDPNEDNLLFPNTPPLKEGEMYLFGLGDQAKWPRIYPVKPKRHEYYHHYPKLQDTASLEAIQDVVEKVLAIENAKSLEDKVKLCTEYIKSSNRLLQFTAVEYAIHGGLWAPPPGKPFPAISHEVADKRNNILKKLADEVISLSLVDSNEPSVCAEAIRFMRYAEPDKTIPLLIPKITDKDQDVRSATRTALNAIAGNLQITDSFVNYRSKDSVEKLKSVQQQWNEWWEENKDDIKSRKK